MGCYRFRAQAVLKGPTEGRHLQSMFDSLSMFGLALLSSTPFELWASSDSGCYSGASVYVSTFDRDCHQLFIEIRSSEPQFLRSSKAKRLAEELHRSYQDGFLCSELEP